MKINVQDKAFDRLRGLTSEQRAAEAVKLRADAQAIITRSDAGDATADDSDAFTRAADDLEFLAHIEDQRTRALSLIDAGATESGSPTATPTKTVTRGKLKGAITLTREDSFAAWHRDNGHADTVAPITLDQILRGVGVGDWRGVDTATRALVEGTQSAGGVLVPTPVSAQVVDVARAQAQVLNAGATVVPMTSATLKIPRVTNEGSAAFYAEGAQRVAQDIGFDAITLTARSFERLIVVSRELLEDSDPNVGDMIQQVFASQFAAGLDQAALYGNGSAPNPLGIVNQPGVPTVAHTANGAAITNYDWLIQAAGAVRAANWEPTAHIVSPRTATSLALLKNTQGDYIAPPATLLPVLTTTNVPSNLTVGTSSDASQIVTGDFRQVFLGLRENFSVRVASERYIDTGQVGFLATMRLDIAVAHPTAFVVDNGVRG